MEEPITFVGLDVSKKTISVALAPGGVRSPVIYYGTVSHSKDALGRLCQKLSGQGDRLHFCYEAGPFGYGLQRLLSDWGHVCEVIAPSLIPKRRGDRVKTDRRDALSLASLLRAGQLSAIWVLDATHEAVRSLVRLRHLAIGDMVRAKQQITSLCLVHDRHYPGVKPWTKSHRRWLVEQKFDHPALSFSYAELLQRLERAEAMVERVRDELLASLPSWALYPLVKALRALRGFEWATAAVVVAEVGDFSRFSSPCQLMAYLGLVPSEASSGEKRKQGEITKMGNAVARRALIEAAWSYRFPAKLSYRIRERSADLPEPIRALAWKAQTRLCKRMRHLHQKGKNPNKAVTAVARELAGFVWAIARMVEPKMS